MYRQLTVEEIREPTTVNCRGNWFHGHLTAEGHFSLLLVCFSLNTCVNNIFLNVLDINVISKSLEIMNV